MGEGGGRRRMHGNADILGNLRLFGCVDLRLGSAAKPDRAGSVNAEQAGYPTVSFFSVGDGSADGQCARLAARRAVRR